MLVCIRSLHKVDFADNQITGKGAIGVARILAELEDNVQARFYVKSLSFKGNTITDNAAMQLVQSISSNKTVKHINLAENLLSN